MRTRYAMMELRRRGVRMRASVEMQAAVEVGWPGLPPSHLMVSLIVMSSPSCRLISKRPSIDASHTSTPVTYLLRWAPACVLRQQVCCNPRCIPEQWTNHMDGWFSVCVSEDH